MSSYINDEQTKLTFGQDPDGYPILTINADAVAQMIRFLAVSISDHYVVTVKSIEETTGVVK